jgi:hypothetical protein
MGTGWTVSMCSTSTLSLVCGHLVELNLTKRASSDRPIAGEKPTARYRSGALPRSPLIDSTPDADHPGVVAWGEYQLRPSGIFRLGPESGLHFTVDRLNQGLDVPVTERESLKTAGIIRVTGHVIRTNRARELCVPQDSHNF